MAMENQYDTPEFLSRCVLGTAGMGGVWGKVDPEEQGIMMIDTAPAYGNAEELVGKALMQWRGPLPVISSKVGRLKTYAADEGRYDYSAESMWKSVEQSLETLGVSSLDILFLHDPTMIEESLVAPVIETLIAIKEKGYTKKIGIGGNPPSWMEPYLKPELFDVLMEYNKLNACTLVALEEHLPFCLASHIQYYAASPLNMGLLGGCYDSFTCNPPAWLSKKIIDAAIRVKALADAHAIALPALAHRFLLSLPYHFKIVIGASNAAQLAATINDFKRGPLPQFLVKEIIQCINNKIS
jgi:D-threo-aldose 1-dehydrogenase